MERFKSHNRSIGREEILTRDLRETLSNETGLILRNISVSVAFDEKDSTTSNGLSFRRRVNKLVGTKFAKLIEFGLHSFLPLGPVGAGLDFYQGLRFIGFGYLEVDLINCL